MLWLAHGVSALAPFSWSKLSHSQPLCCHRHHPPTHGHIVFQSFLHHVIARHFEDMGLFSILPQSLEIVETWLIRLFVRHQLLAATCHVQAILR